MLEKIAKKFNREDILLATRDITFLSSTIFNESYRIDFQKEFQKSFFKNIFWFQTKNKQIKFYRLKKENDEMSKNLSDKFLKNKIFAKKVADDLIRMSDEVNNFIKDNKIIKDFKKNWDYFFKLYRLFFVYHQVVFWSVEYLNSIKDKSKQKNKIKKIIEIFTEAYKYNEKVIPNVEKYFIKLKISDFSFEEIEKNKKSPSKNRSLLLFKKKNFILGKKEAEKLDNILEKQCGNFIKNKKEIKGLAVYKGKVKGIVKVINKFSDFKRCQKSDILVSQMTRPQYNIFIKKVKAIVTDEGGLLCHASILARENKIPCVVGTKIATEVLQDGDYVEVDADNGIIKIIKKYEEK